MSGVRTEQRHKDAPVLVSRMACRLLRGIFHNVANVSCLSSKTHRTTLEGTGKKLTRETVLPFFPITIII